MSRSRALENFFVWNTLWPLGITRVYWSSISRGMAIRFPNKIGTPLPRRPTRRSLSSSGAPVAPCPHLERPSLLVLIRSAGYHLKSIQNSAFKDPKNRREKRGQRKKIKNDDTQTIPLMSIAIRHISQLRWIHHSRGHENERLLAYFLFFSKSRRRRWRRLLYDLELSMTEPIFETLFKNFSCVRVIGVHQRLKEDKLRRTFFLKSLIERWISEVWDESFSPS